MRTLPYFLASAIALLCGCQRQSSARAEYVRATLPYETAVLVKGAERFRRAKPDVSVHDMELVDQIIIEHALRLHICLSDPDISEKDKEYARNVLPLTVSYIATNKTAAGFQSGVEYEMLSKDFMFPPRMKIRDVIDELIQNKK